MRAVGTMLLACGALTSSGCYLSHTVEVPIDAAPFDAGRDTGPTDGGRDAAHFANPFVAGDHWVGTYTCADRGVVQLDLHVVTAHDDVMEATFDFTSGSVSGSFWVTGMWETRTARAQFMPGAWITQPSGGWYELGMDGNVDFSAGTYDGMITLRDCGAFMLRRR